MTQFRRLKPHAPLPKISMDSKTWDEVHLKVKNLEPLEASYTDNSIDVLTSYAGTAAAIATRLSGSTTKYLGKRTRSEEEDTNELERSTEDTEKIR